MHTQVEQAQERTITPQMHDISRSENIDPYELCGRVAAGSVVIMQRKKRCCGIGKGLLTKVNVNLGTSSTKVCIEEEIQKAGIAEKFGADTISDLSMGGDINAIRKEIFSHTTLPVTT
ncbi:MAG: phosphomethylpyrimidine synthase ThiC, partial [Methanoregula sp.]|nr:phosphomethylpyrimidine synthase ThiC [Methanoregula sp.]